LFAHEAAFLRRIRHVNVVGFRESLGRGCMLLEWLPGRPLDPDRDVLGAAPNWWTVRRVLELGLGVARALEAVGQCLHAEFTHNDLAPRNIMIHPEAYPRADWVKLIDFGLSSSPQFYSVSSVLDELGVRLREAYRAPEVTAGAFGRPRSDIYALGVILFQMLTGQLPGEPRAASPKQLLRDAPVGVTRLLERMLDLDPQRRPGNWREVAIRLESEIEHA
jgi:serine/threonine protein kinase